MVIVMWFGLVMFVGTSWTDRLFSSSSHCYSHQQSQKSPQKGAQKQRHARTDQIVHSSLSSMELGR